MAILFPRVYLLHKRKEIDKTSEYYAKAFNSKFTELQVKTAKELSRQLVTVFSFIWRDPSSYLLTMNPDILQEYNLHSGAQSQQEFNVVNSLTAETVHHKILYLLSSLLQKLVQFQTKWAELFT